MNISQFKFLTDENNGYSFRGQIEIEVNIEKHDIFAIKPLELTDSLTWIVKEPICKDEKSKLTIDNLIFSLFNCPTMSDFKIITKDAVIPAHKFILSAKSTFFERKIHQDGINEINMNNLNSKIALCILSYFYKCILIFSESILIEIYQLAYELECDEVKEFCKYSLTPQLAQYILQKESTWGPEMVDLITHSYSISFNNLLELIKEDKFKNLSKQAICVILNSEELPISEFELFQQCEKWSEAECYRKGNKPTGEYKRLALGDLKYLIRFPTMSKDDLAVACNSDLITHDEKIEILLGALSNESANSGGKFNYNKRKSQMSPVNHEKPRTFTAIGKWFKHSNQ